MTHHAEVIVTLDGTTSRCPRNVYVTAKTKQLREFGYNNLTESHVDEQLTLLLNGKVDDLTVIGKFMDGEVSPPVPK